ncbi:MAG: hypothetical protein WCA28_31935, partial [Bradyrhizobium sp.]
TGAGAGLDACAKPVPAEPAGFRRCVAGILAKLFQFGPVIREWSVVKDGQSGVSKMAKRRSRRAGAQR